VNDDVQETGEAVLCAAMGVSRDRKSLCVEWAKGGETMTLLPRDEAISFDPVLTMPIMALGASATRRCSGDPRTSTRTWRRTRWRRFSIDSMVVVGRLMLRLQHFGAPGVEESDHILMRSGRLAPRAGGQSPPRATILSAKSIWAPTASMAMSAAAVSSRNQKGGMVGSPLPRRRATTACGRRSRCSSFVYRQEAPTEHS
jgi:hypothetical protein